MIHVQDLLRSGLSYAELYERHKVHAKPHNGKVTFIYDQLEASPKDAVANQCRGLVLREHTWEPLAYPFDRFFNFGQQEAEGLDLSTAVFEEKLDGTLIIAYHCDGAWHVATRGMCEAHGSMLDGLTSRQLADRACLEMGRGTLQDFMGEADRRVTYCFELTAPENQIVCEYAERKLTLLAARNIDTLQELHPGRAATEHDWLRPRFWELSNLDDVVEIIRTWDPREFEGIVARDAKFHRVKVKAPKYLAVHHAIDSLGKSWRSCMAAVVSGAADDINKYVPSFVAQRLDICRAALAKQIAASEQELSALSHISDMKEFASHATKSRCSGALFAVKRGKCKTVSEFFAEFETKKLVELCGIEDDELTRGRE